MTLHAGGHKALPPFLPVGGFRVNEDVWDKIVRVHGHAKRLTLRAEELDPEGEFFFPPVLQQRDAHDHVVRAQAAMLGLKEFDTPSARADYVRDTLDKAPGHEYRAFFDIADWLAILYREKRASFVRGHSASSMDAVVPWYYREMVPNVERLHREIEAIRNNKDIAAGEGALGRSGSTWRCWRAWTTTGAAWSTRRRLSRPGDET